MKLSKLCVLFLHCVFILDKADDAELKKISSIVDNNEWFRPILVLYELPQGTFPLKTILEFWTECLHIEYFSLMLRSCHDGSTK